MSDLGRSRRRLAVLAALVCVLVAQGAFALAHHGQVYPAVSMPGFGAAPEHSVEGERVGRFRLIVVFADGSRGRFEAERFMQPLPADYARPVLRRLFDRNGRHDVPLTPEVRTWLRSRAERLRPTRQPVTLLLVRRAFLLDAAAGSARPVGRPAVLKVRL